MNPVPCRQTHRSGFFCTFVLLTFQKGHEMTKAKSIFLQNPDDPGSTKILISENEPSELWDGTFQFTFYFNNKNKKQL